MGSGDVYAGEVHLPAIALPAVVCVDGWWVFGALPFARRCAIKLWPGIVCAWLAVKGLVGDGVLLQYAAAPNTACSGRRVCFPPEGSLSLWALSTLGVFPAKSRRR